jgi:hypothetical protein
MVGYDVPHVSHDMILRFMGVNFSAIAEGSARIPSSVGNAQKPSVILAGDAAPATPSGTTTPEMDKAMWEGEICCYSSLAFVSAAQPTITPGPQHLYWYWCLPQFLVSSGVGVAVPVLLAQEAMSRCLRAMKRAFHSHEVWED